MRHAANGWQGRTSSTSAWATPTAAAAACDPTSCCEVAAKPDAHGYSQSKWHPRPAPRAGRLLRASLRGRSRSRKRGGRDDGFPRRACPASPPRFNSRRAMWCWRPTPATRSTPSAVIYRRREQSVRVPTTPDDEYWHSLDRAMNFTVLAPQRAGGELPVQSDRGRVVDLAFYERLVAWARENQVWVVSDLAYSELYFDGKPTPSNHAGRRREGHRDRIRPA